MRWVVATLLLIVAALGIRVTMLDDTWFRVLLAGGDRIGLLAKERRLRAEADRPVTTPPAVDLPAPTATRTSPPVSKTVP